MGKRVEAECQYSGVGGLDIPSPEEEPDRRTASLANNTPHDLTDVGLVGQVVDAIVLELR